MEWCIISFVFFTIYCKPYYKWLSFAAAAAAAAEAGGGAAAAAEAGGAAAAAAFFAARLLARTHIGDVSDGGPYPE